MRKQISSEELFYNEMKRLIENQLIHDPNFKSDWNNQGWYEKNNKMHYELFLEKANYILERMEGMKHLIIEDDNKGSI